MHGLLLGLAERRMDVVWKVDADRPAAFPGGIQHFARYDVGQHLSVDVVLTRSRESFADWLRVPLDLSSHLGFWRRELRRMGIINSFSFLRVRTAGQIPFDLEIEHDRRHFPW